ncbi:hypothetical protein KVR01_004208 [Diaporthe batatas]|uniref:uncharacterized protein n=1 Tax=Diaporthe batatas TaxID=748121 RepID=UPI001D0496BD|nr:uncharacterized protein KVR01_004208 [Diaporthe batatas]KAG8165656.1 hypothetical protein KVR01_004208 [Diaporthe batatas]
MAENKKVLKATGILALATIVKAQASCDLKTETHPPLTWQKCAADGTCTDVAGSLTVDANWRWTHDKSSSTNCYTGNTWDSSLCPDDATCTDKCCVDGADYQGTYGVAASGSSLSIDFVTGSNVGSRLYLLEDDSSYQGFTLLGNEFTFDVDVSNLPCGLNGALYFVSMDLDGGASTYSNAGAAYGTGYCDAQCPRDLKFIEGTANVDGWTPLKNSANSGVGGKGSCCAEMDVWEANSVSTAFTPHTCKTPSYHSCKGDDCGGTYSSTRYAGDCDPDGCDFNSYRQGNESFYGPGGVVDTGSKMTVVTQFVEEGGSLSAIKRFYVQDGKVIANSESNIEGNAGYDSITPEFCSSQKAAFGDDDVFAARGGWSGMSDVLSKPMVLVMSLWDDYYANMLWLDGAAYPTTKTGPGAARGTCSTDSGVPSDVESKSGSSSVVYSNIKFGPIGSTFDSSSVSVSGSGSAAASSSAPQAVAQSSTAAAAAKTAGSATQSSAAAATASVKAAETPAAGAAASSVEAQAQVQPSAAAEAAAKPKTCKRRNKSVQN